MKLKEIFDAISQTEMKLIPLLVTNPETQAIAGIAFVGEQMLFNFITNLHAPAAAAAPVVVAPAPAAA